MCSQVRMHENQCFSASEYVVRDLCGDGFFLFVCFYLFLSVFSSERECNDFYKDVQSFNFFVIILMKTPTSLSSCAFFLIVSLSFRERNLQTYDAFCEIAADSVSSIVE
jgi:hypothetical protein